MAVIATITGGEKGLILDVRQALIYPFTSPNWLDLRLGLFASICTPADSLDTTNNSLIESLPISTVADRMWIGFKNNGNDTFPQLTGSSFVGLYGTNSSPTTVRAGVSADQTVGAWETCYAPNNGVPGSIQTSSIQGTTFGTGATVNQGGTTTLMMPGTGASSPPANSAAYQAGYATLILIKMMRPITGASAIGAACSINTVAGFTSNPDINSIRTPMRTNTYNPTGNSNASTSTLVPDAIFLYWPFFNSRLRIHALVLEKFS